GSCSWRAAWGVSPKGAWRSSGLALTGSVCMASSLGGRRRGRIGTGTATFERAPSSLLGAEVGDGTLDRILGEHRAVDLHRREVELLDDGGVLDRLGLVDALSLDPLGGERRRSDRRAAAEGLDLRILDDAVVADLDLKAHHVATGRRPDEPGAHVGIFLVEGAHV